MARLAINEMTTLRWTFEEDVQRYSLSEIEGIGVWRQKLSDFGEAKGIELLHEYNLQVSSLHWAGGFTGSDGVSFRDCIADCREAIATASRLDAGCLIVHSGSRAGHTSNHARRLLRNALKELLPMAEDYGVTLALEPMHAGCASNWTFLTTVEETIGTLDQFSHPNLKMVLDCYHFGFDLHWLPKIEHLVPHLALVQLGDGRIAPEGEPNRCVLGNGSVPLGEIVQRLDARGYEGFYELELMGEDLATTSYDETIRESRQAFSDFVSTSAS
ncbi:MAG: sugar phosphate isomerase/epimerase [Pirellulaceae bacterium]|jgi:sugar phosphate isomerase/epimerase